MRFLFIGPVVLPAAANAHADPLSLHVFGLETAAHFGSGGSDESLV
jgi:hypothetical protein